MEDIFSYSYILRKLRYFFQEKYDFIEVPAQSRLSILAACEDPETISTFTFNKKIYPLPQTGQMWLEAEILRNPKVKGVFCVTTSYRDEPNPIAGRHDKIFPMFEFESHGSMEDLRAIEAELLTFLGFNHPTRCLYTDLCSRYKVNTLEAAHETMLQQDYGNVVSLEDFPLSTSPFWNMKHRTNNIFNKIDIILYGMETIGSAERSCNVAEMYDNFHNISEGKYAQLLFDKFGKARVSAELEQYLSLPMIPRFGGGIGVTRMARAMKLAALLPIKDKICVTEYS